MMLLRWMSITASYHILFVCLCFTSLQQRGHLDMAPPFTVPCKGMKFGKYTVPTTGIEPQAVAWQSITLSYKSQTECVHITLII